MQLWLKAFHLIFMVTWFAGLFYLPRLFVYHTDSHDAISNQQFKIMERKLFYGITTPGAILTLMLGAWMLAREYHIYLSQTWLYLKLTAVVLLIIYHVYLGHLLYAFKKDRNRHSATFYRWINEIPVAFLMVIVLLAVLKPL
jgi:protoporphyrinogen IX oxidase